MLHLFFISHLLIVVFANPFQKYPYVFLLDVGNEEIGRFNTEQIRLSIPGGSLAVRYPAVGEGDTIGHVRVSGIDFGTDLKATIIQGGPGYKYAVFVFMGNPGVPYDAVVTIQTIPSSDSSTTNLNTKISSENIEVLEDSNDSAEDISDSSETKVAYRGNGKSQLMQSSSNIYQYTRSDAVEDDGFKSNVENQRDDGFQNVNDAINEGNEYNDDEKSLNDNVKGDYSEDDKNEDVRVVHVNRNQYGIYEAFKPHWYGGVRFYPQAALYTQDGYGKQSYGTDNNDDEDEKGELNNANYKDANNNVNNDYASSIEY